MKGNSNDIVNQEKFYEEGGKDFLDNIDYDKLLSVLRRNVVWVLAILLFVNALAFIYVRYTKPLYESTSDLKLDIKSEASFLGLNAQAEEHSISNLSGEIELIKSRIFYSKVIDVLDLTTTYYSEGKINDDERYRNSPFIVKDSLKSGLFYDKPIHVDILDARRFILSYELDGREISETCRFGETVTSKHFEFTFFLSGPYHPDFSSASFYFIINSEANLIKYLEKNLSVEPLNLNANTIRISFTDHNRLKARDLVNTIDTLYLNYTQEEMIKANKQKIDFLNATLNQTQERLAAYENYFEEFAIDNRTINLQSDMGRAIIVMENLDSARLALARELGYLRELEAQISSDSASVVNIPESITGSGDINNILEKLNELVRERTLLLASYKENTYTVKKKDQEIEFLKKGILEAVKENQELLQEELARIDERKTLLAEKFEQLPSKGTEYGKAKRNFSLYEQFLLSLMQSKAEFEIARAGTVTDFKILSPATLPVRPIFPNSLMVYGIGFVSSIILSLLFVGTRYLLHNKINSVGELEKLSMAPVLGVVPFYDTEKLKGSRLVVDQSSRSAMGEALRTIRTNMDFLGGAGDNPKIISITSTVSGEGKTFVSVNLGAIIALSNQKVIVVDMDMRRPKVHLAFSSENGSKGVSTLLINKYDVDACIRPSAIEGLDFLPAGPTPPNPSELILSDELDRFLQELKKRYDVIILDTPPVGLVTDGVLVMRKASLPIYVLRADYSRKSFIKTLNKLIKMNKFKNISIVFNSIKYLHGRGYGYGYGYGYGNSYYHNKPVKKKSFAGLTSLFRQ